MVLKLNIELFDCPTILVQRFIILYFCFVATRPSSKKIMIRVILYATNNSLPFGQLKAEGTLSESAIPAVAKALEVNVLT